MSIVKKVLLAIVVGAYVVQLASNVLERDDIRPSVYLGLLSDFVVSNAWTVGDKLGHCFVQVIDIIKDIDLWRFIEPVFQLLHPLFQIGTSPYQLLEAFITPVYNQRYPITIFISCVVAIFTFTLLWETLCKAQNVNYKPSRFINTINNVVRIIAATCGVYFAWMSSYIVETLRVFRLDRVIEAAGDILLSVKELLSAGEEFVRSYVGYIKQYYHRPDQKNSGQSLLVILGSISIVLIALFYILSYAGSPLYYYTLLMNQRTSQTAYQNQDGNIGYVIFGFISIVVSLIVFVLW